VVAALWPERVAGLVSFNSYNIQNIAKAMEPDTPANEHSLWYQYYFHSERGRAGLAKDRKGLTKLLWKLWSPTWKFDDATFERSAAAFDHPDFVDVVIQSYRHRFALVPGDPAYADIERRLEGLGVWLQQRFRAHGSQSRFVEAFVSSSLVFCVGPLTILGSLSDGLGLGAQQLLLKSTLDGFAAIAFAASLGVGVMASALAVGVIQGALTLVGVVIGDFLPAAHLAAITATGGLLLVGVGLRLLKIKSVPVGNLLPALVVAPLLVQLVVALR
jgi:uncharacterized membrane protein YqgA involved in biofilm formation